MKNSLSRYFELLSLVPQFMDYAISPRDKKQSYYDSSRRPLEAYDYFCDLRDQLIVLGITVEDISIDINDFTRWMQEYHEITDNYRTLGSVCIEKCLEHYLSYKYLDLTTSDVFIDVAAAGSPYVDILTRRSGIESYRLDLSYPEGIHEKNIGADAGNTKLPADFASAMALHCAFECFMGDDDSHFVREASRILNHRGRFVIVPLYLDAVYFIATSPYCNQKNVILDKEAIKVWRDDNYRVPFSRHYSPKAFLERIYSVLPDDMEGKIYFIKNLPDVMMHFSKQRVYCYFMFYCSKKHAS